MYMLGWEQRLLTWIFFLRATDLASGLEISGTAFKYSQARAIDYAKLAGAAYCDAKDLKSWTCGVKCFEGVHSVKVCNGWASLGYVGLIGNALTGNACFAAFEGTNSWAGMLEDMDTMRSSFHGTNVHQGFRNEWKSMSACMQASLVELGCGTEAHPVGVTGHSLGGAVASLASLDFQFSNISIREIYTFGSPRIGDEPFVDLFARVFEGRFFRVTHGKDPFIDMPRGPFFRHLEPEVYYHGDVTEGYTICTTEEDLRCSAQNQPNFEYALESSYSSFHHNYMGVATSQAECRSNVGCDDDIPTSWCNAFIPCNTDARGPEVHCTSRFLSFGKCHCNPGFCPSNGVCVSRPQLAANGSRATVSYVDVVVAATNAGSKHAVEASLNTAAVNMDAAVRAPGEGDKEHRAWQGYAPFAYGGICGLGVSVTLLIYARIWRFPVRADARAPLLSQSS